METDAISDHYPTTLPADPTLRATDSQPSDHGPTSSFSCF